MKLWYVNIYQGLEVLYVFLRHAFQKFDKKCRHLYIQTSQHIFLDPRLAEVESIFLNLIFVKSVAINENWFYSYFSKIQLITENIPEMKKRNN